MIGRDLADGMGNAAGRASTYYGLGSGEVFIRARPILLAESAALSTGDIDFEFMAWLGGAQMPAAPYDGDAAGDG